MNSKRKADLQRKLTLAPVARPPAGLADRIKNDIPEYLRPDADRRRLTRSVNFNLRVAASLLVLISAVAGTIYLLEPEEQLMQMAAKQEPRAESKSAVGRVQDEVQVEITQAAPTSAPVVQVADVATTDSFAAAAPRREAVAHARQEGVEEGVSGGIVGGVVGGTVGGMIGGVASPVEERAYPDQIASAEVAPAPPAAAVAPAPVPEPIPVTAEAPRVSAFDAMRKTAAAQTLVREAHAADLELGPRSNVFGISVDPAVFQQIRETLEKNERPGANLVNLEAIVNYFAGGAAKPPRQGVKLEVEGSPSPVGGAGQRGFLRFTIDTASRASDLPVAANAKLEVEFNGKLVEQATPVGDASVAGPESALLHNLSVTGLYELRLKPALRPSDRVATVRLTYTNVVDGKRKTIERNVYARDFTRLWTRASRRHRLASLGAVWGQSLKVASPAPEVARRAEELATQEPGDERARELATAATASSKLVNSTGF
jgi:von Willebrand factor